MIIIIIERKYTYRSVLMAELSPKPKLFKINKRRNKNLLSLTVVIVNTHAYDLVNKRTHIVW